ncbi:MAG: hypothetical protein NC211_01340 [Alistipes senegalensis]|nr:hypothetical protein [Oxalobacter formigenes]MCM1280468.1 hypothetical protein [Alistipes senegalensis]
MDKEVMRVIHDVLKKKIENYTDKHTLPDSVKHLGYGISILYGERLLELNNAQEFYIDASPNSTDEYLATACAYIEAKKIYDLTLDIKIGNYLKTLPEIYGKARWLIECISGGFYRTIERKFNHGRLMIKAAALYFLSKADECEAKGEVRKAFDWINEAFTLDRFDSVYDVMERGAEAGAKGCIEGMKYRISRQNSEKQKQRHKKEHVEEKRLTQELFDSFEAKAEGKIKLGKRKMFCLQVYDKLEYSLSTDSIKNVSVGTIEKWVIRLEKGERIYEE